MITAEEIVAIHVEITNKCNARCPGCARTYQGKTHPSLENNLTEWSLERFKQVFPVETFIDGKMFTLGGTVDEPMMHSQIYEIADYIISNNGSLEIFSNTGCNTAETFKKLGELSKQTNRLKMFFSVDGLEHTNHLYRINVKWNKVLENMTAYAKQGGHCEWHYLAFKHNIDDIDDAKILANSLGITFKVRQNMRNTEPYTAHVYSKQNGELKLSTHLVEPTYDARFEHKQIQLKRDNKLEPQSLEDFKTIHCVCLHQKEIFIDWQQRLWPCCWFANDYNFGKTILENQYLTQMDNDFGITWNSLHHHSIIDILNHSYYNKLLEQSWMPGAKYHAKTCFRTCGNQGSRQRYKFT